VGNPCCLTSPSNLKSKWWLDLSTASETEDRNSRSGGVEDRNSRSDGVDDRNSRSVESMTGTHVLVEDRNSPTGPVPHSGADSFDCSARDWDGKDYLRIIPRVVLVEDPRLTKGHCRCTANLCYRWNSRYDTSQSVGWTQPFISHDQQSWV
jgi:hypothetical protein